MMFKSIARGALLVAASFAFGTHGATAADAARPAETAPVSEAPKALTTIYDKALAPGWENRSSANAELSIEVGNSPRRPIAVTAGPGQALYLHHAGFDTTGFRRLNFLIQGTVPDREVKVFALIGGKTVGEGKVVRIGNKGWTDVKVPLATLGVEDKVIDGLWIQNASETELPKFYVTDISVN